MYVLTIKFIFGGCAFETGVHAVCHGHRFFYGELSVAIGIAIFHNAVNAAEQFKRGRLVPSEHGKYFM